MAGWKYRPRAEREAEAEQKLEQERQAEIREEKPEGFASRNVKVITFLVCLAVLLILIGPVNIFWLQRRTGLEPGEVRGAEMTEDDVIRLSERGAQLRLSDLEAFSRSVSTSENFTIYTITFDSYLLMAVSTAGEEQVRVCTLTHIGSEADVDVLTGDVRAFFAAHPD